MQTSHDITHSEFDALLEGTRCLACWYSCALTCCTSCTGSANCCPQCGQHSLCVPWVPPVLRAGACADCPARSLWLETCATRSSTRKKRMPHCGQTSRARLSCSAHDQIEHRTMQCFEDMDTRTSATGQIRSTYLHCSLWGWPLPPLCIVCLK
jgi:hypothetical protein